MVGNCFRKYEINYVIKCYHKLWLEIVLFVRIMVANCDRNCC